MVLTSIQPYAEAGSFLDDVTKWQKKLQVIETTVQMWLSVQDKWTQLEEVFIYPVSYFKFIYFSFKKWCIILYNRMNEHDL